jgi:GWxTD domain-containing protein
MKKLSRCAVLLVLVNLTAVLNASQQTNDPPAPAPATQAPPPQASSAAPAKQAPDLGVRKLSRRERKDRIKNLSEKFRQFLTDVDPIMNPTELDTFLVMETDPQREIYVTEFWRRRDVANGTTNHSFRDQYYERLETAKEEFRNVSSDRSRIYLIHGAPNDRIKIDCRLLQPAEIWKYVYIPGMGHDIRFLFFQARNGIDFKLFNPIDPELIKQLISQD